MLSSSGSTGSVVTLKRKGSSDTIRTVTSSAPIVVDVPLIKQLHPTPPPILRLHLHLNYDRLFYNINPQPQTTDIMIVEWEMAAVLRGAYATSLHRVCLIYSAFSIILTYIFCRLSYYLLLLFYFVHIQRMGTLDYYWLLLMSVFSLNK
jgi:hypothetical protein